MPLVPGRNCVILQQHVLVRQTFQIKNYLCFEVIAYSPQKNLCRPISHITPIVVGKLRILIYELIGSFDLNEEKQIHYNSKLINSFIVHDETDANYSNGITIQCCQCCENLDLSSAQKLFRITMIIKLFLIFTDANRA